MASAGHILAVVIPAKPDGKTLLLKHISNCDFFGIHIALINIVKSLLLIWPAWVFGQRCPD
jgi:hypothetical protein